MDIEIVSQKKEMDGHVLRVNVLVPDAVRARLVDEALQALAGDAQLECYKDALRRELEARFGARKVATDVTAHVSSAVAGEVAEKLGLKVMFAAERKHEVIDSIFDAGDVGQELEFVLQPTFELSSYEPVYVERQALRVSDEQVERYLNGLIEEQAKFVRASGPIAEGDYLLVDMSTEVNGELEKSLSGQRMTLELARGKMPDPFVDAVAGLAVGETKLFDFELQNGGDMDSFHVDITIRDRRRRERPQLDDAFVKERYADIGSTVDELRAHARELLEAHAGFEGERQRELAADAELATRLTTPIPDLYIERMSKDVYTRLRESLADQGLTVREYMEREGMNERQFQMSVMAQARDALRQGFALDALFAHMNDELDDADIDRALAELAPGRQEEAGEFFRRNGTWSLVTQMAGRLKAHDWLMKTAAFATV